MFDGPNLGVWMSEEDWKRVLKRDVTWQARWAEAKLCDDPTTQGDDSVRQPNLH